MNASAKVSSSSTTWSAIRKMERACIPPVGNVDQWPRTESVCRRYDIVADADLKIAAKKIAAKKMADYHAQQKPQWKVVGGHKVQCPPTKSEQVIYFVWGG
jgi:hypothetical protein